MDGRDCWWEYKLCALLHEPTIPTHHPWREGMGYAHSGNVFEGGLSLWNLVLIGLDPCQHLRDRSKEESKFEISSDPVSASWEN